MATDYDLRLRILGDDHQAIEAIEHVAKASELVGEKIADHWKSTFSSLKREVGWFGVALGVEKGLDLASIQVSAQKVQSTLLNNQKAIGSSFVGTLTALDGANKTMITGSMSASSFSKIAQGNLQLYSSQLDNMATQMSLQTGIAKNQVVQAQNLLLPNKDLVKLFSQQAGTMQESLNAAANISAIMGGNGRGIAGTSRMLGRLLADPAKSMGSMKRFGVTLSQQEQARIKQVEKTNGLLAAQALFLKDITQHTQGLAVNSISPMEKLKNSVTIIFQTLGLGLLPILDTMAKDLAGVVNSLLPILQGLQGPMRMISDQLGKGLSMILAAVVPLVQIFSQGFLPLIVKVAATLFEGFGQVAKVIDTFLNNHMKQIVAVFTTLTNIIASGLTTGLNEIAGAFQQMANSGQLGDLFQSLTQSLQIMMPILPAVLDAFSQFIIALLPIAVQMLPVMVQSFRLFAILMKSIFLPVAKLVSEILKVWQEYFKGLDPLIAGLAAIWFTRDLFVLPLNAIADGFSGIMSKGIALMKWITGIRAEGGFMSLLRGGVGKFFGSGEKAATHAAESAALGGAEGEAAGVAGGGGVIGLINKIKALRALKTAKALEEAATLAKTVDSAGGMTEGLTALRGGLLASGTIPEAAAAGGAAEAGAAAGAGAGGILGVEASVPVIGWIAAAITAIGAAGYYMYKHFETFRRGIDRFGGFFTEIGKGFATAGVVIWHWIDGAYQKIVHLYDFIISLPGKIGNFIVSTFDGIVSWIENLPNLLLRSVEKLGQTIWGAIVSSYRQLVPGWMQGVISSIGSAIGSVGNFLFGGSTPVAKHHNGGVVQGPLGREMPTILRAGEGVLTISQMNALRNPRYGSGGGNMVIHPNAVTINVQGSVDPQVAKMIQDHVSTQFGELQRTLRSMGR